MADKQEETKTTQQNNTIVEHHDLDLTLTLSPLNHTFPCDTRYPNNINKNNILQTTNGHVVSKREQQAIRRYEAKVKRDFKRKGGSSICNNARNGVIIQEHNDYFGRMIDGENRSSVSSASSSAVSDNYHSHSAAGENSSDTSSHSSHCDINLPTTSDIPVASSSQEHIPVKPVNERSLFTNSTRSSKSPEFLASPNKKPNPNPMEAEVVTGEPILEPSGQDRSQERCLLSQMPNVTTTGNGPNGKTITGFLYKYTKGEVSIVCVCHGASFSPAGFVEHAGGVDVEHPLKHIKVAPFPLG